MNRHPEMGERIAFYATATGVIAVGLFELVPLRPTPPTDNNACSSLMTGRALIKLFAQEIGEHRSAASYWNSP